MRSRSKFYVLFNDRNCKALQRMRSYAQDQDPMIYKSYFGLGEYHTIMVKNLVFLSANRVLEAN